jgi:hypothetical protein
MIDTVLREVDRIRRVSREHGILRLELVRWTTAHAPSATAPAAEFIAVAADATGGGHPCGDGLLDDLRTVLGHEAIAVTVMDEDAARAHDALIERGVTVFREAGPGCNRL